MTHATAPRIAPGGLAEAGLFAWVLAKVGGWVSGTEPTGLFLTLGRQHALFRGWLHFGARLMPGGRLPRRDTELVILWVAQVRDSAYEREHHRRIGRRVGLSDEELRRVADGPDAEGWTPRQRVLLSSTDMLLGTRDLDDAAWARLRAHLDETAAIEFLLLVGNYDMVATVCTTLRMRPDRSRR